MSRSLEGQFVNRLQKFERVIYDCSIFTKYLCTGRKACKTLELLTATFLNRLQIRFEGHELK